MINQSRLGLGKSGQDKKFALPKLSNIGKIWLHWMQSVSDERLLHQALATWVHYVKTTKFWLFFLGTAKSQNSQKISMGYIFLNIT